MNTTIYDEFQKLYTLCPDRNMQDDLMHYLQHGYIFTGPNYLLVGKRINDGWFIHAAVGRGAMAKFIQLMPYYLPFIGWARQMKGRDVTWHRTETILRRINMKLTVQQMAESCRHTAANIVAQYRDEAPENFDPQAFGGSTPKPPLPPAPPDKTDASKSLMSQGKKVKPQGYQSTLLTGGLGDSSTASNVKTLLGA